MERAEAEAILDREREAAVALLMQVGELIEANRRLEARVGELEQRLNRNSQNSSLPPSQDRPSAPPRPQKPASGRRRGGQPGHAGRKRPLLPLARVNELIEHWPERCQACARAFGACERVDAAPVQRHQVCALPPIAVTLSEHRLHRLRCPGAAETRAQLPAEVPRGAFGPRLQAAVATLAIRNRVCRRDSCELVRELFGAELSTGAVEAIVRSAGEALALPSAELLRSVQQAPAVNVDESGWRTAAKRRAVELAEGRQRRPDLEQVAGEPAGALVLGRADQQPRRARPPRRGHLPQALARQPDRGWRAHDRAAPLDLPNLSPAAALALRLPRPPPRRQSAPRPRPLARVTLSAEGLNAYAFCLQAGREMADFIPLFVPIAKVRSDETFRFRPSLCRLRRTRGRRRSPPALPGMISVFITPRSVMARRTVNLPDSVEALAREHAEEGESFSATVARLIEAGARATRGRSRPRYVGSGEGPEDLGRLAERYLRELVTAR